MAALPATAAIQDVEGAPASEPTSVFGNPLVVNGKHISDQEIKRYIVYGHGKAVLESRRLRILVNQELELRLIDLKEEMLAEQFAGKTMEDLSDEQSVAMHSAAQAEINDRYLAKDDYFQWIFDGELANFKTRWPSLDYNVEIARVYLSRHFYEQQLRQTLDFDQAFFPGDPFDWPEVSKEAIYAGSPQVDLITDFRDTWLMRVEAAQENETFVKPEDEMFMGLLRDYMIGALTSLVVIETAVDGLPEHLVMVIDGGGFRAEIKTDDIYAEIESTVTQRVIDETKLYLAMMAATRDRLESDGVLMDEDERLAELAKITDQLAGSMFDLNFIAVHGHRFPSIPAYMKSHHLTMSFRKLVADGLSSEDGTMSEDLEAHLPTANMVMGLAKADAEIMLVSAFDFSKFEWRENGWALALEEANGIKAKLDEHAAKLDVQAEERRKAAEAGVNYEPEEELVPFFQYWSETLDLNSDYWDPPMPATGKMPPMNALKSKGRFGPMTRNDLDRAIGQSSYTKLLYGDAVADRVFYEIGRGQVGGPYEGPHGYYMAYLKERTAPTRPLNPSTDRHLRMLEEDFVTSEYGHYARRALAECEVTGL
jgi:hypothetical protein